MFFDWFNLVTVVALVINTVALIFVIYQSRLARQSIDDAKKERQLEVLPKFAWVIDVKVYLERWRNDLQKKKEGIEVTLSKKEEGKLKGLSNTNIKSPKDLKLPRYLYAKMPSWLREIWMSGAQYYFDAVASLPHVWYKNKPNPEYAKNWAKERCADSIEAISELLEYIEDMVPAVILNTPASVSETDFLRD